MVFPVQLRHIYLGKYWTNVRTPQWIYISVTILSFEISIVNGYPAHFVCISNINNIRGAYYTCNEIEIEGGTYHVSGC